MLAHISDAEMRSALSAGLREIPAHIRTLALEIEQRHPGAILDLQVFPGETDDAARTAAIWLNGALVYITAPGQRQLSALDWRHIEDASANARLPLHVPAQELIVYANALETRIDPPAGGASALIERRVLDSPDALSSWIDRHRDVGRIIASSDLVQSLYEYIELHADQETFVRVAAYGEDYLVVSRGGNEPQMLLYASSALSSTLLSADLARILALRERFPDLPVGVYTPARRDPLGPLIHAQATLLAVTFGYVPGVEALDDALFARPSAETAIEWFGPGELRMYEAGDVFDVLRLSHVGFRFEASQITFDKESGVTRTPDLAVQWYSFPDPAPNPMPSIPPALVEELASDPTRRAIVVVDRIPNGMTLAQIESALPASATVVHTTDDLLAAMLPIEAVVTELQHQGWENAGALASDLLETPRVLVAVWRAPELSADALDRLARFVEERGKPLVVLGPALTNQARQSLEHAGIPVVVQTTGLHEQLRAQTQRAQPGLSAVLQRMAQAALRAQEARTANRPGRPLR